MPGSSPRMTLVAVEPVAERALGAVGATESEHAVVETIVAGRELWLPLKS